MTESKNKLPSQHIKHKKEINQLLEDVRAQVADARRLGVELGESEELNAVRKYLEITGKYKKNVIDKVKDSKKRQKLEELRTRIQPAYSRLIKSAFAPESMVFVAPELDALREDEGLPAETIDISADDDTQNTDFVKKIEQFQKAQEEISRIGPATPFNEKLRVLSNYFDIFVESGLSVEYKLFAEKDAFGKNLPEKLLVAENDTNLVKDVLNVMVQLNNPSFVLDVTTDRELKLICGHLQIPTSDVDDVFSAGLGDKMKALDLLNDRLDELLPNLFGFSAARGLLEDAINTAKTKEELYEDARKLMNRSGEQLYSDLAFELNKKIESFKRSNPNLDQKTEKEQLKAFSKLNGLAQEVFTPLFEEREKISERTLGLQEILRQIEEYRGLKNSIEASFPDVKDDVETTEQNRRLREAKIKILNSQFLINLNVILPKMGENRAETLEELDDIEKTINRKIADDKPQLLMYDMIHNRLKNVFQEESRKQNLNLYFANIEKKLKDDPDTLTPEEIYNYATTYELGIPGGGYLSLTDDNHREMIQLIKYGWGGRTRGIEYQSFRDGKGLTEEEFVAMRGIQAYMFYADTHTNDTWAEEDKKKVRDSLDKVKFRRIDLLQMTNHPIFGKKMTAVLDAYLEQPTLRTGSLPDSYKDFDKPTLPDNIRGNAPGGKLTASEEARFRKRWADFKDKWRELSKEDPGLNFEDFYKKNFVLHERLVYRMVDGKRKLVQLAADRCVKNDGKYVFYIGEEMQSGDQPYLEASSRFSYNSLAGANGRSNSAELVNFLIQEVEKDPERFGLTKEDAELSGIYEKVAHDSLIYLVLALPTLTEIYAKVALQTQTSAHPYDDGDFFFNLFDGGDLSRIIHTLERYRLLDGIAHGLIYYKDFDNGKFGASGVADRLNYIKHTMEDGALAIFGDGAKNVVSQIDPNDRDRPDRLSIKNMYKLGPNEWLSFPEGLRDKDGRVFPSKIGKTEKGYEPFDWSLFWIAGNALIKINKLAVRFYEKGSIKKKDLLEGVKNELTSLIKDLMGQVKMSDFGTVFSFLVPRIFHIIMRQSRSIDEHVESYELYEVFKRSLEGAAGQLGTLQDMGLAKGWIKELLVDPLLDLIAGENERDGYRYDPTKKNAFMMVKELKDNTAAGLLGFLLNSSPTPRNDQQFSGIFVPTEPGMNSPYFHDFIVPAIRSYWRFMVKEYDLHLDEEIPIDLDNYGPIKNWILKKLLSVQGEKYGELKETLKIMIDRLSGEVPLGDVIARPVFDKK